MDRFAVDQARRALLLHHSSGHASTSNAVDMAMAESSTRRVVVEDNHLIAEERARCVRAWLISSPTSSG
jgi:hypothetical protein